MKAEELRNRAFLALYRRSMSEGVRYYSLLDVTRESGTPMPSGLDKMIAEKLSAKGWIRIHTAERFDDEEGGYVEITWDGIEAAEAMLGAARYEGAMAPASDRYVTLADNQRREVTDELAALSEEARGANEVAEEDRLIALSEIAAFEATIVQQRVSSDLIQRFVDRVLKWMMTVFTGAALAEVAQRLIQMLLTFIA